jgi:U3 small nucleolar RNA-associated protein 10
VLLKENSILDKDLNRLLQLLSPWAFDPNGHLVLEYLVRRYRVHEFNVDQLLRALIVSHDTKVGLLYLHPHT